MISGSDSTDLYYLKYIVVQHPASSAPRCCHNNNPTKITRRQTTIARAPPPPSAQPQPSSFIFDFDSSRRRTACTSLAIATMLTGRLAICLSLVGWRVKPDPGDWRPSKRQRCDRIAITDRSPTRRKQASAIRRLSLTVRDCPSLSVSSDWHGAFPIEMIS